MAGFAFGIMLGNHKDFDGHGGAFLGSISL
jgi:hypothetical protein